jgi:hypothetical protein
MADVPKTYQPTPGFLGPAVQRREGLPTVELVDDPQDGRTRRELIVMVPPRRSTDDAPRVASRSVPVPSAASTALSMMCLHQVRQDDPQPQRAHARGSDPGPAPTLPDAAAAGGCIVGYLAHAAYGTCLR